MSPLLADFVAKVVDGSRADEVSNELPTGTALTLEDENGKSLGRLGLLAKPTRAWQSSHGFLFSL
jgi:hypothetical protein